MLRWNPSELEMAALPNAIGNAARLEELAPMLSSTTFTDLEQHRLSMKGWDMQYLGRVLWEE